MLGGGGLTQVGRVFASRNYALNQAGQVPHWIASWMLTVGVGWIAWELTHSPAWLGILAAAEFGPTIVLAPIAGASADRVGAFRQLRFVQALQVLQAATLLAFVLHGDLRIEVLTALVLAGGMILPFSSTARFGVVPQLIERQHLSTAIALDSALFQSSRFIGPALAALSIPFFGVESVFIAHAAANLAYLVALHFLRLSATASSDPRKAGLLGDIGEGLRYVRHHGGILPIFAVLLVISLCARPLQDMLAAFAGGVFDAGATGLAWLTSALGVGSMISAILVALRGSVTPTGVLAGSAGLGVSLLAFVATDSLLAGIAFAACIGFSLNSLSTRVQALVQTAVDDQLRSRVMGVYMLIFRGTPALGALLFGLLAESLGLRISFALAAAACIVIAAVLFPQRNAIGAALSRPAPDA